MNVYVTIQGHGLDENARTHYVTANGVRDGLLSMLNLCQTQGTTLPLLYIKTFPSEWETAKCDVFKEQTSLAKGYRVMYRKKYGRKIKQLSNSRLELFLRSELF